MAKGGFTRTGILAACAIVVGLLFRFVLLGTVAGNGALNQDEAYAAYEAYSLLNYGIDSHGYHMPVYLVAWGSGMNALETYLMIPFIALLGPTPLAVRLPQCLLCAATLFMFYCFAKRCRGDVFAVVAVAILAIMPWHIMMGRFALESNLLPGMLMAALLFLDKSRDDPRWMVLSAAFFGLSLYCYAVVWVIMPLFMAACVFYIMRWGGVKAGRWLAVSIVLVLVMAAPLVVFVLVNVGFIDEVRTQFFSVPKLTVFRGDEMGLSEIPVNLRRLFSVLVLQEDGMRGSSIRAFGYYYLFSFPFIVAGMVKVALDARANAKVGNPELLIAIQFLAAVIVGALTYVNVNRINIVHIPMIYFLSVGLYWAVCSLARLRRRWVHRLAAGALIAAYAVSAVLFCYSYFGPYNDRMYDIRDGGLDEALAYVQDSGKQTYMTYTSRGLVLFYTLYPTDRYVAEAEYVDPTAPVLHVKSIGNIVFWEDDWKGPVHPGCQYLCRADDETSYKYMVDNGMEIRTFGTYALGQA